MEGPSYRRRLCTLITIDVENAFNSAPWNGLLGELQRRNIAPYLLGMITSYFEDRLLLVGENGRMDVTSGVPQGSVIGPTLWNLYYDGILRVEVPEGVTLVAFADDLGVVVTAKTEDRLKVVSNHALHNVTEWLLSKGLKLAPHKTEAVLLVGGRKVKSISLEIEETEIKSKESVKYLGVLMDRNMSMGAHVRKAAEKANKAVAAIGRLMPKVGGPRETSRKILCSVVQSTILYGASIWQKALEKEVHRKVLLSTQRRTAIICIGAYRTTSTRALLVVARIPPIHLMVQQRVEQGTVGKGIAHTQMLERWQEWWHNGTETGLWTKRLIPNLLFWVSRKHGDVSYHLTQLLTGHGCFQVYRKRFHVSDSEACIYCNERDTVDHTFFQCARWYEERLTTELVTGQLTADNVVTKMLEGKEQWAAVSKLARVIIAKKEKAVGLRE